MSVYEQGYRRWEGQRRTPLVWWLAIPKFAFMEIVSKKLFMFFLTAALALFFLFTAYIYLFVSPDLLDVFPGLRTFASQFPIDASVFLIFMHYQITFCVAFAFQIGAGLMTRDFEHQAFILYFSKPISRLEYFVGKLSVLFAVLMTITAGEALLLVAIQKEVSPVGSPWHDAFWASGLGKLPLYILLYSLVIAFTINLLVLAASCFTKNSRYAGTLFAVALIGLFAGGNTVATLTGDSDYRALSPMSSLWSVGFRIFNLGSQTQIGARAAWTCLIITWVVCALLVKVRLDIAARRGR